MSVRSRHSYRGLRGVLALATAALTLTNVYSNSQAQVAGEQVVAGNVTFVRQGNQLFIYASNNSIINYDAFSIAPEQLVQFFQPGVDSQVLNRILGAAPTHIDGTLLANGRVFFANPAGIIFGRGAVVNVGGIFAAAASITDANFIDGVHQFTDASGAVINYGSILGEAVHLFGRQVANHGLISAPRGLVTMLAGDSMFIGEVGGNLLVRVDGRTVTGDGGPASGTTAPSIDGDAGVENTGTVTAGQGRVVIGAGDLYSLGIHNAGSITAFEGQVELDAADGLVHNEGFISASAKGGDAGSVVIQGPSVLNEGSITADSRDGIAGYVELTSQDNTLLADTSVISASGLGATAQGGEVLINSYNGYTLFDGEVAATGGTLDGNGGFVEVSGANLSFQGMIDLGANGASDNGTLLIDPWNLNISPIDVSDVSLTMSAILAGDGTTTDPSLNTINQADLLALAANANIILEALNDLTFKEDLALNFTVGDNQDLTVRAGHDVIFEDNVSITGLDLFSATSDYAFVDGVGMSNFDQASDGDGDIFFGDGAVTIGANNIAFNAGTGFMAATTAGVFFDSNGGNPVNVTSGFGPNLTLQGKDGAAVGTISDLTWTQDATIDLSLLDVVTLDTVAGNLTATNLVLQSHGGNVDVNLAGDTVSVASFEAGSADAGTIIMRDDLVATGDITLHNDTNFVDGDGPSTFQRLESTAGTITAEGDLSRTDEGMNNDSLEIVGDLNLTGTGDQTISVEQVGPDANETIRIGGNVTKTGGGGFTLDAVSVDLNGAGAQTLSNVGGTMSVNSGLVKGASDLVLQADTINLGGGTTEATAGALTLDGATNFTDDVSAQSAIAGTTLSATGDVTKTGDNLTLQATTIDLGGSRTDAATGNLTLTGATNLTNAGIDQTLAAGGDITSSGLVTKNTAAGDLLVEVGGAFELDFDITASNGVTVQSGADGLGGDLTFGATTVTSDAIALQAGDGAGNDLTAIVDFSTGTPLFEGTGGGVQPGSLTWRQDGLLDNNDGTQLTAAMVGGGSLANLDLTLQSDDNNVQIDDSAAIGDTRLTLQGQSVDINQDLSVRTLDATATDGAGAVNLGGTNTSTTTTVGDLTLSGAVNFANNAAAQTANAAIALNIDGNVTNGNDTQDVTLQAGTGSVNFNGLGTQNATLGGGTLLVDGNLDSTGDLNLSASGIDFSSAGGQTVTMAGGGTLAANSTVSKGSGDLVFNGAVDLNNNTTVAGNLTFNDVANVGGDLSVGLNLNLHGAVTFDAAGGGVQLAQAGTGVDVDGTLGGSLSHSNIGNELLVFGPAVNFNGLVDSDGSLRVVGPTSIGADTVHADSNLTFQNAVTFTGAGMQTASAGGTLRTDGTVAKGTGDLMLQAGTLLDLNQSVDATLGSLTIDGPSSVSQSLTAGTDINIIGGTASFDNIFAQSVTAGGVINADVNLIKGSNNLTLDASSILLGGDTVEATAGDLILAGATTFDGGALQTARAGGTLDAQSTVTKAGDTLRLEAASIDLTGGTASVTGVGGRLELGGDVTNSVAGNLTLGAETIEMEGQSITTTNGAIIIQGDLSKNTVPGMLTIDSTRLFVPLIVLEGNVDVDGDLNLMDFTNFTGTGDQTVDVTGSLVANGPMAKTNGGNLSLTGDTLVDLNSSVTVDDGNALTNETFASRGGDFENSGGAITAGTIDIQHAGDVTVGGDLIANTNANSSILVRSGSDGVGNMTITAANVRSPNITLWAGSGNGVDAAASIDFSGIAPGTLQGSGGVLSNPDLFTWRQDADIDNNALTALDATDFGANTVSGLGLTLQSDGGNVIIDDGARVTDTLLTLNGQSVNINSGFQARTIDATAAAAGGAVTTANGQDIISTVGAMTLTGDSINLGGEFTESVTALTLNGDVSFTNGALAQNLLANGALQVNGTVTKAANDLTMAGSTIALNGATNDATLGTLQLDGSSTIQGNLSAGTDIVLNGPTNFANNGSAQSAIAGGTLFANGNVTKAANNLTLEGANMELAGANTEATTGNLTLNGVTDFTGAANSTQTATGGGTLTLGGVTDKVNDGTLRLEGTTIDLTGGQAGVTGLTGRLELDGNVTRSNAGNLRLAASTIEMEGDSITTSDGVIIVAGELSKNTVPGTLTLDSTRAASPLIVLEGDVDVNGNLVLQDAVSLNSAAAVQNIDVTGTLTANGSLTRNANDLGLSGNVVDLNDIVQVNAGNLTINAPTINLGGASVSAGLNLTLQDGVNQADVTFDGAGLQTARANLLDLNANISKTGGDLTLDAPTINFSGSTLDVAAGDLSLESLVGATTVNFDRTVVADENQTASASGDILTDGNLNKAAGDLTLDATSVNFNNDAAAQSVAVNAGALNVDADVTKAMNDLTLSGVNVNLGGTTTATTAGDLTVNGATSFTDDGFAQTAAAGGAGSTLEFNGNVTKASGDLTLDSENIELTSAIVESTNGDLNLLNSSGTTLVSVNGVGTGELRALGGNTLDIDGNVTKVGGDLVLDAASIELEGGLVQSTSGNLTMTDSADGVTSVTFDGAGAQTARASGIGGALNIDGNASKATNNLRLEADAINLGGASTSVASGNLTLDGTTNFTNNGVQQTASASGVLATTGNVSKASGNLELAGTTINLGGQTTTASGGNLTLDGATNFTNNLIAQTASASGTLATTGNVTKGFNNLTLDATVINLGGLSTSATAGNLTLDGPTNFTNNGSVQSASAGGTLATTGDVTKALNDLTLQASTINLGGTSTSATAGGLTLDGVTNFSAAGVQSASAGTTLSTTGNVTKAASDLTLTGSTIDLGGASTSATLGDLTLDGTTNFTAAGVQSASAGGTLATTGNVTKATSNLMLTGVTIDLGGASTSATLGSLTLDGVTDFSAAGVQSASAGTSLATTGNVAKGQGNLTLQGTTVALGGVSTSVAGGDLTLDGASSFTNNGVAQSASASGELNATGTVTKAQGDLTLDGNPVDVDDTVNVLDGSLIVNGSLEAARNLTASTNISLNGTTNTFDGDALVLQQTVSAGGNLLVGGTMQKDNGGNLRLEALGLGPNPINVAGDITVNTGGSLIVAHDADLGGDVDAGGDATFLAGLTLSSALTQQLMAGGDVDFEGTVTKATGNLQLDAAAVNVNAGSTINVAGNLSTTAGTTMNLNSLVVGNTIETGTGQTYGGTVNVNENALLLDSNTGSLAFNASVNGDSDLTTTTTDGDVIFESTIDGLSSLAANVGAGDTIALEGDVGMATALGSLTTTGGTTVFGDAGSAVAINTTGAQNYTNAVDLANNATLTATDVVAGTITFGGAVGNTAASVTSDLDATADTITFNSTVDELTGLTVSSSSLTNEFNGDVGGTVAIGSLDATGTTQLATGVDVTTTGHQSYHDLLVLPGDAMTAGSTTLSVTGDGSILSLEGGVDGAFNALTLSSTGNGATVSVTGNDVTLDSFTTSITGGASSLELGTSIRANQFTFDHDITLVDKTSLTDINGGGMIFNVAIDGSHGLTVNAHETPDGIDLTDLANGDNLTFSQSIGMSERLTSFSALNFDQLFFQTPNEGDNFSVMTNGNISLGGRDVSDVPVIATIIALNHNGLTEGGTLLFDTWDEADMGLAPGFGHFTMGVNEKMTAFGTVDINALGTIAGGIATISDINALDDLQVEATTIQIRTRAVGSLILVDDVPPVFTGIDLGVDFTIGGSFLFEGNIVLIGGGTGNVGFTYPLANFTDEFFAQTSALSLPQQPFEFGFDPDATFFRNSIDPSFVLDREADGSTLGNLSEALASALPRESAADAVPQDTPVGTTELDRLRQLGIQARRLTGSEHIRNLEDGIAVYSDSRSNEQSAAFVQQFLEVTDKRLLNERVGDVLDRYDRMIGAEAAAADPTVDRRAEVKDLLSQARVAFVENNPGLDMTPQAFRSSLGDSQYAVANTYFVDLAALLKEIELLGLTRREFREVETYLLREIASTFMGTEYLKSVLEADLEVPSVAVVPVEIQEEIPAAEATDE